MPRILPVALALLVAGPASGDEFDRLAGEALAGVPGSAAARAVESLTFGELGGLPNVLPGIRSAPLVVKTDQGNLARLIAAPGLRNPPGGEGRPIPILVLERFETLEAPRATDRLARGHEVVLYDGFRIDLDSGGIVPDGLGGDLRFVADGDRGPRLEAIGPARLYTLSASPLAADPHHRRPSAGRAVVPGDFAGRYRLFGNGQWSGTLELAVPSREAVEGRFRSDQTGHVYKVTGQVAADVPQKVLFEVQLPRARLAFTGYLWTEGKGAMAGTASLQDRDFGFFALRDGGRFAPEGEGAIPALGPGGVGVELRPGGLIFIEGKEIPPDGLAETLKSALAEHPEAGVTLTVPPDMPYREVMSTVEALRAAGAESIRFGPIGEAK